MDPGYTGPGDDFSLDCLGTEPSRARSLGVVGGGVTEGCGGGGVPPGISASGLM